MSRRDVVFESEGAELQGWLYEPSSSGAEKLTLVVMANGFSATRRMSTDAYAEVFARAGLAVLLYDHRGLGDSGGEPRRQINPWIQARGYRDAIAFATALDGVDPERIAVWGDSSSAGVALAVAGVDERVAALVAQVPAIGREPPPPDPDGALYRRSKETLLAGDVEAKSADELRGPMPVVSDDPVRRPAALEPNTAFRWFIEYGCRFQSGWVNDVTRANPRTPVAWHAALFAPHVTCPTFFVVSEHDEMPGANPAVARAAFERIAGPKRRLSVDGGHFGLVYVPSREFEQASSEEASFLTEVLGRPAKR